MKTSLLFFACKASKESKWVSSDNVTSKRKKSGYPNQEETGTYLKCLTENPNDTIIIAKYIFEAMDLYQLSFRSDFSLNNILLSQL